VTSQEIIDSFKQERRRFGQMRADPAIVPDDSQVRWDSVFAHVKDYLDQVDPKRAVITDGQLLEAVARATLEDAAERLH
jgi:hypothetical protein